MKTTPLLLRPDMARAWAEERKTRTQRIAPVTYGTGCEPMLILERNRHSLVCAILRDGIGPVWQRYGGAPEEPLPKERLYKACRYGGPGDRLNLITTWAVAKEFDDIKPSNLLLSIHPEEHWSYFDSAEKPEWCGKLRPGRFMPKWLRELMPCPEILEIGGRRIQAITDEECVEEGLESGSWVIYRDLWESINANRGYPWESNPWVWNIEFEGPR